MTTESLTISWDANGNLLPIVDADNGKNATGVFLVEDLGYVIISVKNGKLQTGKVKATVDSKTITVTIDKDFGISNIGFK